MLNNSFKHKKHNQIKVHGEGEVLQFKRDINDSNIVKVTSTNSGTRKEFNLLLFSERDLDRALGR